jgi:hypothetical protein
MANNLYAWRLVLRSEALDPTEEGPTLLSLFDKIQRGQQCLGVGGIVRHAGDIEEFGRPAASY